MRKRANEGGSDRQRRETLKKRKRERKKQGKKTKSRTKRARKTEYIEK